MAIILESLSKNHSFIKKINLDGARRIPDVELNVTPDGTTVYSIKFILDKPVANFRMFRVNSLESSFSTIHSIDFCDKRLKPKINMVLDQKTTPEQYFKLLTKISNIKRSKLRTESFMQRWREMPLEIRTQFVTLFLSLFMTIVAVFMLLAIKVKQMQKYAEVQAATRAEEEINRSLFSNQNGKETEFDIYSKLIVYLNSVINGKSSALIISGPPGLSKTYMVKRTLYFSKKKAGRDYFIEKGATATLDDVYQMLYNSKNSILVLDDFDAPLRNENMINLLKSITDTYSRRIISRPKEKMVYGSPQADMTTDAPDKFVFNGKIIIITNLDKDKIDTSLRSRCPVIQVNFNSEEVINSISKMLEYIHPSVPLHVKEEVYYYILKLYKKNPTIRMDFRKFISAVDARIGVPADWKDIVNIIILEK